MTIFIFNPEHDYALAEFRKSYTPPKPVRELRQKHALVQLPLAAQGDAILLLDSRNEIPNLPPGVNILTLNSLKSFLLQSSEIRFAPWGWNPAIRQTLIRAGVPEQMLPSEDYLKYLRQISNRQSSILFNEHIAQYLSGESRNNPNINTQINPMSARQFDNPDDAINLYDAAIERGEELFFKLPWSSSGRGILFTGGETRKYVEQWVKGAIKRQGSVMCEHAISKVMDLASEWLISKAEGAQFLGWSMFEASEAGRYSKNVILKQSDLQRIIEQNVPGVNLLELIRLQRNAIEELFPKYEGYLGIDMLIGKDGKIYPCIEINFRTTMGIIALHKTLKAT